MLVLPDLLAAWGTQQFPQVFAAIVQQLPITALPLQQGLSQSSHVTDSPRTAILLHDRATDDWLYLKAGLFYSGIIAGSCCADDPTPLCEQTEYCEILFEIDRHTAVTRVSLLPSTA